MTGNRIACCGVALALCWLTTACGGSGGSGPLGDPEPGTDPGTDPGTGPGEELCGAAAELSDVGEAMLAVVGEGGRAKCAGFPEKRLMTIAAGKLDAPAFDPEGVSGTEFVETVASQLRGTRSSFELASLSPNGIWEELKTSEAIRALNESIGALHGGGELREDEKPVLRFLYTSPGKIDSAAGEFAELTAGLGGDPATWNVRVIVKRTKFPPVGWNHDKLVIVDGEDVTTTSYEATGRLELALRLTGDPARPARAWFDEVFARSTNACKASVDADCDANDRQGPPAPPPVVSYSGPVLAPVNVLSLERGPVDRGMVWTADDALFAGMGATKERIFLLQQGLNGVVAHAQVSEQLVESMTDAVALRGVDAKIVWGFTPDNPMDEGWSRITSLVERRLAEHLGAGRLTVDQAITAMCMIRAVPFNGDDHASAGLGITGSHAKFYMLDDGFYVGSQNLYPSEIRVEAGSELELADHGFFVDAFAEVNHELTDEVTRRIVEPVWDASAEVATLWDATLDAEPPVDCARIPHPMRLDATLPPSGACTTGALAILDFRHVKWNEIATVIGAAVCHGTPSGGSSTGGGQGAAFSGTIEVGGRFHGQLVSEGSVFELTGTWTPGLLSVSLGGSLGPSGTLVSGVEYYVISATSWGEPHLVTLDGLAYDFQQAGEFVAVESATAEPFTVQVRQQPWGGSRKVAVNTAVAMRVGEDRVGVYAGRPDPLLVNGVVTPMVDRQTLVLLGGGLVTRTGNVYAVEWPYGTGERVQITDLGDHLDYGFGLPAFRRGGVRGLFGNFDGDPGNDVATRGTETILVSPTAADFYAVFGASWRLSSVESLFDYAGGESTATFTDLTFPDQFVSARNLTDAERAAAQAICAASGITDPVLLEACILDVAVTGDPSFAAGAVAAPPPAASYGVLVNLAAGRPVTVTGPYEGGSPQVVTDGIYAPEGTVWNDGQYAVVIPGGTSLTIDLGAVFAIHQVIAQVDNNDTYLVEISADGVDWSASQVTVPSYGGGGLRTRPTLTLDPPVQLRYVRIQAASGDGMYSASELELRGPSTPVGP